MQLTTPIFVHENSAQVVNEMKADMEVRLGRVLAPADVEMLIIQAMAYRETLLRTNMNDTARQNMVAFSRGNSLDYLGELVGVSRLPASGSACTIRFTLIAGHGTVTIPAGIRVQSTDGKVVFITLEQKLIAPVDLTVDINCACTTTGKAGNDYAIGTISVILDPLAFVVSAANLAVTVGGADNETDEELRERIKLAPASFSVAGPDGAYKYFAKSAHSSIVDVTVTSPTPGDVYVYPLLEDGQLPTTPILDAVAAILNDEKVRPLTDTVYVVSPTRVPYAIAVDLTLITGTIDTEALTVIQAALDEYKRVRKNQLGIDVIRNQISALCMLPGKTYDCVVTSPVSDIVAAENIYTNCTGITLNVTGYHDE